MNRTQKKTLVLLLGILVGLGILLAVVSAVKRSSAQREAEEAAAQDAASVITETEAAYSSLTYDNGNATLSFHLDEAGKWVWSDDPEFPLDDSTIQSILTLLTNLKPQQTITEGDTLEAYGLDQPFATLTAAKPDGVRVIPCDNTAMAAKMVAEKGDRHAAAISSHPCAALYGLTCLNDSIQDSDNNYTRFICITKDPVIYAGANRISLIIAFDNRPGALYEILSKLAALDINMTKLESCPVAGSDFEFVFFLELDASVQDPSVLAMLEEMERSCAEFQFLGNYAEV